MNRRQFTLGAGALASASFAAETPKRAILEFRHIQMRTNNDSQMQRTSAYLSQGVLPALERAGAGPIGFFAPVIASESPFILSVTQFPDISAWETMREQEAKDPEYRKIRDSYLGASALGFERLECSLGRCFASIPGIETPPAGEKSATHIFELRMYESNNGLTLERKIRMFNEGEIGIFRRLGMRPVFFTETLAGTKMPNLVYMLAFDSMAARESAWTAFGSDPEWKELRSKPGNSDAELVGNISNSILRPLAFSRIR